MYSLFFNRGYSEILVNCNPNGENTLLIVSFFCLDHSMKWFLSSKCFVMFTFTISSVFQNVPRATPFHLLRIISYSFASSLLIFSPKKYLRNYRLVTLDSFDLFLFILGETRKQSTIHSFTS